MISPDALYQHIVNDDQSLKVLAATDLTTYRQEHVPGASHVWWQDTMELNARYYGMVLKPDDNQGNQNRRVRFLERLGVSSIDSVVVYGENEPGYAARVCWFLRFLGINAAVLDGGQAGWLGINGSVTDHIPDTQESTDPIVTPQENYYLFAEEIANLSLAPGVQLIDLRETEERTKGPYRGLKIGGAIDVPRSHLVNELGLIRAAGELTRITQATGIDLGAQLILIAPTGLDAANAWLAFSLLGARTVTISDGGWQEWVEIPGLPLNSLA